MRSSLGELLKYQYLDMAIQKCSQLRLRQSTHLLGGHCAIFEQNQSWDAADTKLSWNALVLINVHFGNLQFARISCGDLV